MVDDGLVVSSSIRGIFFRVNGKRLVGVRLHER